MTKCNKIQNFSKTGILLFIAVVLILPSSTSNGIQLSNTKLHDEQNNNCINDLHVTYSFTIPTINKIQIGDTVYDRVTMKDAPCGGNAGEPNLPTYGAHILIPPNSVVKNIIIIPGEQIHVGSGYDVEPIGECIPLSHMESAKTPVPNEKIYRSNERFPDTLFTKIGIQSFRGYEILVLALHPVQYIPATGDVFYYSKITVSVTLEKHEALNPVSRCVEKDRLEVIEKVDNPSIADLYPLREGSTGLTNNYDLLIITTDNLTEGFLPLKQAHDNEGLKTAIYSLENILNNRSFWVNGTWGDNNPDNPFYEGEITSNYALFNDTQCQIRNFIRYAFKDLGISYVLLGGDTPLVAARDLYVEPWPNADEDTMPSDLYYACLDGTYNHNGDQKWGEPTDGKNGGDVDLLAEVYVGRACADNLTEVGFFVNKTLAYMNTDDPYLTKILMAGEWLGGGGPSQYAGPSLDELVNESSAHGYTTKGFPAAIFSIDRLYDENWPGQSWPKSEVLDRINNDVHIIDHLGHGNNFHVMKLDEPVRMKEGENYGPCHDVLENMTNNHGFFIYSQACYAGAFDNRNVNLSPYGHGEYLPYDCIAEYLTAKSEHGAFAGVLNARFGWGISGSTDSPSQRYNREFWDAVFGEYILELGHVNQDSKEDNLYRINDACMRWCYYELNLFGDPIVSFKFFKNHDISVDSVTAPSHVHQQQTPLMVNTTIANRGRYNETNILVTFRVNDVDVDSHLISFLPRFTSIPLSFSWIPQDIGRYVLTMNATLLNGFDEQPENNEKNTTVYVGVFNENTGKCYATIQAAIDDPDTLDGHTIYVPSGMYPENVMITKRISLLGEDTDTTIIEGTIPQGSAIHIQNINGVNITHFTIRAGAEAEGVCIQSSTHVLIHNTTICDNALGIHLPDSSCNNIITKNEIINNQQGVGIDADSTNNLIYLNSFNNTQQNAYDINGFNQWDNGYLNGTLPRGGNYWSDYIGMDNYSGPGQNEPGPDGIGDTPYTISGGNSQDRYPLIRLFNPSYTVMNLNTHKQFTSIQDAIDDTDTHDGHTIRARRNTYYENIIINKSITLLGEYKDAVIIDGKGIKSVIEIKHSCHVNISGFTIQNGKNGVQLYSHSDYCNISGNNIRNNHKGIYLQSSDYNYIGENIIANNSEDGIYIGQSCGTKIIKNHITNNSEGLNLDSSENTTIRDNQFICDGITFSTTYHLQYWNTHTIENNSINGKPIYYSKNNHSGGSVPSNTAQVILANCSNFTIQGLTLDLNVNIGIQAAFSSNNTFSGNTITGIDFTYSSNNTIKGNTIIGTSYYSVGIYLLWSSDNLISHNIITGTTSEAIRLYLSSRNTLSGNTIVNNSGGGINCYYLSSHNTITKNTITNNQYIGIYLDTSSNNTIGTNTVAENKNDGVYLDQSSNNNFILENTIKENKNGICIKRDLTNHCYNNLFYHNNFINNMQNAHDECTNYWDNGYPSGGNYWDDYGGNDGNHNGFGDTVYAIPGGSNQDQYPLMHRFVLGDMNVDGKVDFGDIDPFVLALSDPATYQSTYHLLPVLHGDCNQDGAFNFADIDPFVALLSSGK